MDVHKGEGSGSCGQGVKSLFCGCHKRMTPLELKGLSIFTYAELIIAVLHTGAYGMEELTKFLIMASILALY